MAKVILASVQKEAYTQLPDRLVSTGLLYTIFQNCLDVSRNRSDGCDDRIPGMEKSNEQAELDQLCEAGLAELVNGAQEARHE